MLMVLNHSSFSLSVPLAEVDHQLVVQDPLAAHLAEGCGSSPLLRKASDADEEVTFDVLADRDRALLAVDDFETVLALGRPST